MELRENELSAAIKVLVPNSRSFVGFIENNQGGYVEVTTFIGTGEDKERLDFAWPAELFDDLTNETIAALVEQGYRLRLASKE